MHQGIVSCDRREKGRGRGERGEGRGEGGTGREGNRERGEQGGRGKVRKGIWREG